MIEPHAHPARRATPARADGIDCVFLTCFGAEFSLLAIILQYSRIRLQRADTLEEADFLLTATGGTVLIADFLFLDGSWRDALGMAVELHPFVGALVAADPVDAPFLSDSYARGSCGALWKPVDSCEAIRAIRSADQASRDRVLLSSQVQNGRRLGLQSLVR